MKINKCSKCSYEWKSRVDTPKQCPRCKRYDYLNTSESVGKVVESNRGDVE